MSSLLPAAVFKRAVFAVGTPGAGKSHGVAEGIVIPLLELEQQVVIIDPTDAWFGLALTKSGKQPSGFNITVFGGEHGSVPLTPNMGRAMGTLLGKEPISAVLSIWHFTLEEQIEFVSEFSAAIMEVNRKPITLVIDEADEFIPQKPELGRELLKCKLRTKRIVTRGRKPGFRPVLITQRPQALDTAARNGCQVMMAFQCTGHHERTQIEDYVKSNGDPKVMSDMLGSLSSLQVGEAWVWAPRDKILKRVQFPKIKVFDSFDAIDEKSVEIKTVPISDKRLSTIHDALKEFEEERKANDPELLRKEIAGLKKQLAAKQREVQLTPVVSKADFNAARAAGYNEGLAIGDSALKKFRAAMEKRMAHIIETAVVDGSPALIPLHVESARFTTTPPLQTMQPKTQKAIKQLARAAVDMINESDMTGPERKIMNAMAIWSGLGFDAPTRAQIAAIAGYHPGGPSFTNPLGSLRTKGLIEYGTGTATLTAEGNACITVQPITDADEIHNLLRKSMDGPQTKIFDALIPNNTAPVTRVELAAAAGYHPGGPSFTNPLGALRKRQIVDYGKGTVFLRPWVFGE